MIKHSKKLTALAATVILGGLIAFSTLAFSGDKDADKTPAAKDYGDWRVVCSKDPKDSKKQSCEMFQHILFGNTKKNALSTFIHTQPLKDKGTVAVVNLVTPLGTLLSAGIKLKIDDGKELQLPFMQCEPAGCIVNLIFDGKAIDKLKSGSAMLVTYMAPNKKEFPMKVSLKGFSQAYAALDN